MKTKNQNQRAQDPAGRQPENRKSDAPKLVDIENSNIEHRSFQFAELRVVDSAGGPVLKGHAAVFDKLSEDLGGYKEKISPGAFKQAIKKSDVRALFNHDPNFVLGRTSNNTLTIKEDKEGLFMEVIMPDTQMIRDLVLSPIRRGDIREQSFGFIVEEDEWQGLDEEDRKKTLPTRTIRKVSRLFDVSPVTFPAYPDTDVAIRSMHRAIEKAEKRGGIKMINPVEEIILNSLSNLEELKRIFEDKDEDEIRDHFKQLVMNLVAFVSPDKEFNDYDELISKTEISEPTQGDSDDNLIEAIANAPIVDLTEDENRNSSEPMQAENSDGEGEEPTSPQDDENVNRNLVSSLLNQYILTPIEYEK